MSSLRLPVSCNKDCGAGCPLIATVQDGLLTRITDNPLRPASMRGCARGYAMGRMVYARDRVARPLLASGPRGSGQFREAGWEEALERVASGLEEVRQRHGPEAVLRLGGSGSCRGALHNTGLLAKRFLVQFGGATWISGNYSAAAEQHVAPYLFGTPYTGLDPVTLLDSRLILLWGANIVDTRFGAALESRLRQCRRKGIPVIALDPRRSRTAERLADEWIPVRPGTDAALMSAVLYVLLEEGLADQGFIARYTTGFPQVEARVRGASGGQPRTPSWAEEVCGTPAERIARLARRYAACKPAALIPGLSIQRTVGGEEAMRLAAVLQAATGNAGLRGGSTGGCIWSRLPSPRCGSLPVPPVPPDAPAVPVYRWADAVLEGRAGGYPSEIRAVYNVGGNYLCQGADVRKNVRAFEALDFAVCHDLFLTPTARYCDVVLPVTSFLEREDIVFPDGNFLFYSHKVIEPRGEARDDYEIFHALAARLGFEAEFSEGLGPEQWLERFLAESEVPDVEEFRRTGIYAGPDQERTALAQFIADPDAHPLGTPSGRIELASPAYAAGGLSAVPEYRGFRPPAEYPLALVTPHARYRVNSQFANDAPFRRREPQELWMNPADAGRRGIGPGGRVRVSSPQGELRARARVTEEIMPGVVCLANGVWPELDSDGIDNAGSANLLTSTEPTLPSQGARTHSVGVEVRAEPRP
jgi:anaerobic dimethyl sulfoxide reductase subunit A